MPRKPRLYMAGVPCHVIQRGNNRQACFFDEQDYQFYLDCLKDACDRFKVALHACVLMTNHVHMPVTTDGISQNQEVRLLDYITKKLEIFTILATLF